MNKILPIILAAALTVFAPGKAHAQTSAAESEELKGTIIGSAQASYASGGAEVAFDNDLSTFYGSDTRSNTYVGLDLGTKHVITKVAFASRAGWAQRMLLGVFEGANNADFTDAVPLYLISSTPEDNVLTEVEVNVSRGFRYVRYVGPNDVRCNVAEIKFFGYEGEGDDSQFYSPTNLPVVVIHTDEGKAIDQKEVYIDAILNLISENGKKIYTDSTGIRGRGNASWSYPKKPYKLKLANKKKLLGMPAKAKKWTLINNYSDKTLIRNILAFRISEQFGMPYTPAGRMVDVMVNGEYEGTYQLCDQIEVKKNRVDVTEMTTEDNATPEITGGYLIECDAYASGELNWFTSSNYGIPVTIKSPGDDELTSDQKSYITKQFNLLCSRTASSIYRNPNVGYAKYLDVTTFLKYFLIEELCGNTDAYWSTYMYKDRDSTRFYTGPVWDFDLAFENDSRTHPINNMTSFLYASSSSSCAGNMRGFVNRIIGAENTAVKEMWAQARCEWGITEDSLLAIIDSLQEEVYASQDLNFKRWPIMNSLIQQNYQITGSYEGEMDVVRDYIKGRITWLDNMLNFDPVGIKENRLPESSIAVVDGGINIIGLSQATTVRVYDISGMQVATLSLSSGERSLSLTPGIYIVKADNPDGTLRKKVIIK